MASTYLTNTNPTAGNRTKGTISVWFKRNGLSSYQLLYSEHYDGNNFGALRLNSNDTLSFFSYDGGSAQADINTNRVFRDTNAWYHVVASWDTTDGTASDRVKIYINGVRETSFGGSPTYPSSSQNIYFGVGGTNYPIRIGSISNSAQFFDGSMSHFHRVDNQALAQTVFGSTDATTGEWKINTNPSITYTGSSDFNFFILKDGNSVTDQSGNSNNLTVGGGTLTKTEDCPSNVFATLNALDNTSQTLSNGNTSGYGVTNKAYRTTLGFQGGKYYWEAKCVTQNTYTMIVGLINETNISNGSYASSNIGTNANGWAYFMQSNQDNGKSWHNNTLGSTYQTISQGDILQIAVDGDAGKIWWGVNGTWVNSGNPANGTNAVFTNVSTDQILFPSYSAYNGSGGNPLISFNFGNGYFGTTAVSSAGTNASGIGIFEYDVPTGYTALSTKGLNL